jgi:hypothetical protein
LVGLPDVTGTYDDGGECENERKHALQPLSEYQQQRSGCQPAVGLGRWRLPASQVKCSDLLILVDIMPLSHSLLRTARTIHLYLGVFSAPMLLFFALTGGLQTFGLHESSRGSDYKPPAWLATMAQLHKKQTIVTPARRPRPVPAEMATPAQGISAVGDRRVAEVSTSKISTRAEQAEPEKNLWPMKIFFAIVAFGLLVSVLSGLYMAWRFSRKPRLFSSILAAGVLVPLLLLLV